MSMMREREEELISLQAETVSAMKSEARGPNSSIDRLPQLYGVAANQAFSNQREALFFRRLTKLSRAIAKCGKERTHFEKIKSKN